MQPTIANQLVGSISSAGLGYFLYSLLSCEPLFAPCLSSPNRSSKLKRIRQSHHSISLIHNIQRQLGYILNLNCSCIPITTFWYPFTDLVTFPSGGFGLLAWSCWARRKGAGRSRAPPRRARPPPRPRTSTWRGPRTCSAPPPGCRWLSSSLLVRVMQAIGHSNMTQL